MRILHALLEGLYHLWEDYNKTDYKVEFQA